LKRGWTQSWRNGSALLPFCLATALSVLPAISAQPAFPAQAPLRATSSKNNNAPGAIAAHRHDELTLASLRPGRDAMTKAQRLFTKPSTIDDGGANQTWQDTCRHELLSIIADPSGTILEVRVAENNLDSKRECAAPAANRANRWITGHGLVIGDSSSRVLALYGQPGSRGPSTKDGQQLELFYYAFDWAGPDVPQVMTVLCTPAKDDKPGRVVEITLAAPSL
jgi:hypothetical protein